MKDPYKDTPKIDEMFKPQAKSTDLAKMLPELNAAQLKWLERYVAEQRIDELEELKKDPSRITHHGESNAFNDGETVEFVEIEVIDDRIATLKKEAGV